ncbi:hypothetical protein E2C01_057354 [Portunus trituberculatus]|uniref:Uncharacterized protein n=1 Tax=Portunus trituberculatus TaxID=210409 RepID=A0A5B7H039_PORTR|nr:hypothetical protein [Portunus trituberculatus]
MENFEKLKVQAELLGLEGKDLGQWILQQQQQAMEWEERAFEREERERQAEREERQAVREQELRLAELASGDKKFESLKEFMVLDQFLSTLNPKLHLFIKERHTTSLSEAV